MKFNNISIVAIGCLTGLVLGLAVFINTKSSLAPDTSMSPGYYDTSVLDNANEIAPTISIEHSQPSSQYKEPSTTPHVQTTPSTPSWAWGIDEKNLPMLIQAWQAFRMTQGPYDFAVNQLSLYMFSHPIPHNNSEADPWLLALAQSVSSEAVYKEVLESAYVLKAVEFTSLSEEGTVRRRKNYQALMSCRFENELLCHYFKV